MLHDGDDVGKMTERCGDRRKKKERERDLEHITWCSTEASASADPMSG